VTLDEATVDDLFKEIRTRFPEGALLAFLKPCRDGEQFEPVFECHTWNTFACIGLARVTEQLLVSREAASGYDAEEINEEGDEEES